MDGHDDVPQFTPADDPVAIGVVQRENPGHQKKKGQEIFVFYTVSCSALGRSG